MPLQIEGTIAVGHADVRQLGIDLAQSLLRAPQSGGICVPVMQVRRTALTFGDRPFEYRVSIVSTAHHDYVNLSTRPTEK